VFNGPTTSYAFTRLELLAAKFNLHILLNGVRELDASKSVPHRDFYNVRKVDTHVHHSVSTINLIGLNELETSYEIDQS
jgi:AMP deaminase